MHLTLVGLAALLLACVVADNDVVNQRIVDELRASGARWEVQETTENPFMDMSEERIRGLMGTILAPTVTPDVDARAEASRASAVTYPREFDARQEFKSCLHPIRNQLKCGSCWAFSVAETWADNACILGLIDNTTAFSTEDLLACATFSSGKCAGGRINYAFDYIASDGLVTEQCMPYTSGTGKVESCPQEVGPDERTCTASGVPWKATLCDMKANNLFTTELMKAGIVKLGAVAAGYSVYADFMNYKGGIYKHVTGKMLGGHAIKVVGWGIQNATATTPEEEYWIVANSWGGDWGEHGYFRFSFNDTDCHFGMGGTYNCGAKVVPTQLPDTNDQIIV